MSVSPKTGITDLDNFLGAAPASDGTRGQVPTPVAGDETKFLRGDGTWAAVTATSGGSGTVTYVDVSGGLTGLLFTGGPITASGIITASGTLGAGYGGTGKSTYAVGDILYATGTTSLTPLTIGASGQVLTASNGVPVWTTAAAGSSVNATSGTVDFGFPSGEEGDVATVTVTATWVLATSNIICAPYAIATADHDPEDYAVEGITSYVSNLASGVGFDIIAAAPQGTWGRYTINAYGV